jgi:hypothetical protein
VDEQWEGLHPFPDSCKHASDGDDEHKIAVSAFCCGNITRCVNDPGLQQASRDNAAPGGHAANATVVNVLALQVPTGESCADAAGAATAAGPASASGVAAAAVVLVLIVMPLTLLQLLVLALLRRC